MAEKFDLTADPTQTVEQELNKWKTGKKEDQSEKEDTGQQGGEEERKAETPGIGSQNNIGNSTQETEGGKEESANEDKGTEETKSQEQTKEGEQEKDNEQGKGGEESESEEESTDDVRSKISNPFQETAKSQGEDKAKEELRQLGVDPDNITPAKVKELIDSAKKEAETQTEPQLPEEFQNDKLLQEVYEWRKNGGEDINEIAQQFVLQDPSQLDSKERYRLYLQKRGFGKESIDRRMEKWDNDLEEDEKEEKAIEASDYLKTLYQQSKEKSQNPNQQKSQEQIEKEQREHQEFIKKQSEKIDQFADQIKGSKVTDNFTITDDMVSDLVNRAKNEQTFWTKDENGQPVVDVQKTFDHHLFTHYRDQIFQAYEQAIKSKVRKEVWEEVNSPSSNDKPTGGSPNAKRNRGGQATPESIQEHIQNEPNQKPDVWGGRR